MGLSEVVLWLEEVYPQRVRASWRFTSDSISTRPSQPVA